MNSEEPQIEKKRGSEKDINKLDNSTSMAFFTLRPNHRTPDLIMWGPTIFYYYIRNNTRYKNIHFSDVNKRTCAMTNKQLRIK